MIHVTSAINLEITIAVNKCETNFVQYLFIGRNRFMWSNEINLLIIGARKRSPCDQTVGHIREKSK